MDLGPKYQVPKKTRFGNRNNRLNSVVVLVVVDGCWSWLSRTGDVWSMVGPILGTTSIFSNFFITDLEVLGVGQLVITEKRNWPTFVF